jgi:hypothetical protein
VTPATFDFFLEFGEYCFVRHPLDVWINASTLVTTGVLGPSTGAKRLSLRSSVSRSGGLEWLLARTTMRRSRFGGDTIGGRSQVVGFSPFSRHDYEGLLHPYLRVLARGGTPCSIVTSERGLDRWRLHAHGDGIVVYSTAAAVSKAVYRDARRTFETLRTSLRDIVNRYALDAMARRDLRAYFVQFAFEKALATALLDRISPRVVVGFHFVSTRGWQAAIEARASTGTRPRVVFVQHGAFDASEGFHDFEGADVVLLWGERWRRELARFEHLPFRTVPAAVVTGHPKYDVRGGSHLTAPSADASPVSLRRVRVLFVSGHDGGRMKAEPLAQVSAASMRGSGFDFMVKPHPAERDGALARLVADGKLAREQVLSARQSIQACILDADVVVGPESTALFEASRLGRPVVLLSEAPSSAFEGFLTAADSGSISDLIERWRSDASWRRFVLDEQSDALVDAFGSTAAAVEAGSEVIRIGP